MGGDGTAMAILDKSIFQLFKRNKEESKPLHIGAGQSYIPEAEQDAYTRLSNHYLSLPDKLPFELLDLIDMIVDFNGSVSYAIENKVALINSGHTVECSSKTGLKKINELAKKVNMDNIVSKLARNACAQGAFALEAVINEQITDIVDIIVAPTKRIRFRYENGKNKPYQQLKNGKLNPLNTTTFLYVATNTKYDSPYGLSPLLPSVRPSLIQAKLFDGLEGVIDKMSVFGQLLLKIDSSKLANIPGEPPLERAERIKKEMNRLAEIYAKKKPNQPIVVTEAVQEVDIKAGAGKSEGINNILMLIDQELANGTKIQSSLINQNNHTTETYSKTQYEIQIKNIAFIQKQIKRALEYIYNLALQIWGINATCTVSFNENKVTDRLYDAQAEETEIRNARQLYLDGIIDHVEYAKRVGYDEPKGKPPDIPQTVARSQNRGSEGSDGV